MKSKNGQQSSQRTAQLLTTSESQKFENCTHQLRKVLSPHSLPPFPKPLVEKEKKRREKRRRKEKKKCAFLLRGRGNVGRSLSVVSFCANFGVVASLFFECQNIMEGNERLETHVSCLYPEILALIFSYLDVKDKGSAAQVCIAWREAAYHKSVWRGVEAKLHLRRSNPSLFQSLVQRGIRRVQVLSIRRSLRDVVHGIPNIESLNLIGCYNLSDLWLCQGLNQDVPTLTVLNLSMCKQITDQSLRKISEHATNLQELDLGGCSNVTNSGLLMIAWGSRNEKPEPP
ncbi:hypothetical protein CEXT_684631 [Caerostris extrusa]|uniref:F-box domain-containing protein n=1 Tax=Caerostris extrusa TaxID=172846 RepID=A0AAV4N8E8_CAEEX|nr:hypothetical protein CEXT_684631 [Caerostris extrusa]